MGTLVCPAFDHLALGEIGVARCDKIIKQLEKISYSRAKQARGVLRLALELAVRHEVLPRNPMGHVSRLHREPHIPDALMAPEVNRIRAAIARWEAGANHVSGPKSGGQLGAIVEVMLGTSARIGEVLAIRRRDVDVTSAVPSIRLAGTIVNRRRFNPVSPTMSWSTSGANASESRGPMRTISGPAHGFCSEGVRPARSSRPVWGWCRQLWCPSSSPDLRANGFRKRLRESGGQVHDDVVADALREKLPERRP
jgi:hypothetical protein